MSDTEPVAPAPKTYEYKYLEIDGVRGSGAVIGPINDLGAQGWRIMSFDFNGGVYRVMMERVS